MANDWNQTIIDEFRANGAKVGGQFEGAPLLILHSTGAKSGQERVIPLMYRQEGEDRPDDPRRDPSAGPSRIPARNTADTPTS